MRILLPGTAVFKDLRSGKIGRKTFQIKLLGSANIRRSCFVYQFGELGMAIEIPGTEAEIHAALDDINLPNLLLVLASITGSDEFLDERFQPAPVEAPEGSLFPDDTGRYSEDLQAEIKQRAAEILIQLREGQIEMAPAPDQSTFQRMLTFSLAEEVNANYAAMLM